MQIKLFLLVMLAWVEAAAQNSFVKTYGDNRTNFANTFCLTPDKGYLLGIEGERAQGSAEIDMVLVKTDHNGVIQWQKAYYPSVNVVIHSVAHTSDDGYVVATTLIFGNYVMSPMISKFDSAGNVQWSRKLQSQRFDAYAKIKERKNGGFLVCALTDSIGWYKETALYCIDANGNSLWSKRYSTVYNLYPENIIEMENGDITIAAYSNGYNPNMGTMENTVIFQADSIGNIQWARMFATTYDDIPGAITKSNNDDIFVCGRSYFIHSEWDSWVISLDKNGITKNTSIYDAGSYNGEIPRAIATTDDGGCAVFGDMGTFNERDLFILKLKNDLSYEWSKRYIIDANHTNYAFDGFQTPDKGFAFAGDNGIVNDRQPFLIKTNTDGSNNCNSVNVPFSLVNDNFTESDVTIIADDFPVENVDEPLTPVNNLLPEIVKCERKFPIPDFTFIQTDSCNLFCGNFSNSSLNDSTIFDWKFTGAKTPTSISKNPLGVCFADTGIYEVELTVTNPIGTRTVKKDIILAENCPPLESFFIPNVFTPDGDGVNDDFYIKGLPANYSLQIFNRWGSKVFEQENKRTFWKGENVTAGVYFYKLEVTMKNNNLISYSGTVSVVK